MQYLGGLRGSGTLTCGDAEVGRADYDFDGYLKAPSQVLCSGEVRMPPQVLCDVFGRRDVHLITAEGRRLSLRFSGKQPDAASDAVHVDVGGELPTAAEWRH